MSNEARGRFSVVIPTLQRAPELHPLVEQCAEHPLVLEVLVINNAPEPLRWESPKVRVLQQAENIYVNPAWNLGAREARGEYLAIINDDALFDPVVLDIAADFVVKPRRGILALERSFINRGPHTFASAHCGEQPDRHQPRYVHVSAQGELRAHRGRSQGVGR